LLSDYQLITYFNQNNISTIDLENLKHDIKCYEKELNINNNNNFFKLNKCT